MEKLVPPRAAEPAREGSDMGCIYPPVTEKSEFMDHKLKGTIALLSSVVTAVTPEELIDTLLEQLVKLVDADGALLYFLEHDGYHLWSGDGIQDLTPYQMLGSQDTFIEHVVAQGTPVLIFYHPEESKLDILRISRETVETTSRQAECVEATVFYDLFPGYRYRFDCSTASVPVDGTVARSGFRSSIGMPLVEDGKVVGAIECVWHEEHRHDSGEVDFVVTLIDGLGPALVELFNRTCQRATERRNALLGRIVTTAFFESTDGSKSSHLIMEIKKELAVDFIFIQHDAGKGWRVDLRFLPEASGRSCPLVLGNLCRGGFSCHEHGWCSELVPPVSQELVHEVQKKRSLCIDGHTLATWMEQHTGYGHVFLIAGSQAATFTRLVAAVRKSAAACFTKMEEEFLQQVVALITSANDSFYRHDRVAHISDTLQESLAPHLENVIGIEQAHRYHSATELACVGGDFYGITPLKRNRACFFIGDISGKGVEAAMMSSCMKAAILAYVNEGLSPAEILASLNRLMMTLLSPEGFSTLFLAVLDLETGRGIYSSAGHPPVYILRVDSTLETLDANSPLLGAFHEATYGERAFVVEDNDIIYLYTDGITEARDDEGEVFGSARLCDLLLDYNMRDLMLHEQGSRACLEDLVQEVSDAVADFAGEYLFDDVAQYVLRLGKSELRQ